MVSGHFSRKTCGVLGDLPGSREPRAGRVAGGRSGAAPDFGRGRSGLRSKGAPDWGGRAPRALRCSWGPWWVWGARIVRTVGCLERQDRWGRWFGTVHGPMYHSQKSHNVHRTEDPGKDRPKELVISFTSSHSRTSEGPVIGFAHPAARELRLGGTQAPGRCCVGGGPAHPRVKCPPEPSGAT